MAEKKPSKSVGDKKRLDISAKAIVDNIVFSKTDRWAYYRLSNTVYDFLSNAARISVATQLVSAFNNLVNDRQEPLECHLIIASTPVDVDAWESQIRTVTADWSKSPGFDSYINSQVAYLRNEEYLKKVTYLGINIGKRGALDIDASTFMEAGVQGAIDVFKTWMNTALQTPNEEVTIAEEKETRRKEEDFYRILSTGNLRAERATAEELLLLVKRQFYPAMSVPYLNVDHGFRVGPGDLDLELASAITNRFRWLKINQMIDGEEYDGYRAVLSIGKLPKSVEYPEPSFFPFMYFMHKLGLPFLNYARFTLHPTGRMKQRLEKKKKEQKDELENIQAAGNATVDGAVGLMPSDVTEALEDMQLLNQMLRQGGNPWVEGSYRIVVETPDEKMLKKYCAIVQQQYADIGVTLVWTSGDQADLFLEQMPGDKLRSDSHKQLTDLVFFGTSGFTNSADVGDLVFGSDGAEGGVVTHG